MKSFFIRLITAFFVAVLALLACVGVLAADGGYNWYCVHRKDHKQPFADAQISFVERYNGYYIDKKHGDNITEKVVYLTFDAGYENGNVGRILDTLREEKVTAAFFVLGNLVENNTDLINRMFDEGHLVCNHTYTHRSMVGKSKTELAAELKRLEDACLKNTGRKMEQYYRPPEGRFDEKSMQYLNELGYKTVFWSFAYADWDNNKQMSLEAAKTKILENVHNGEVMLLHPTSDTNAAILGDVIRELKAQGFRFGDLHELCGQEA